MQQIGIDAKRRFAALVFWNGDLVLFSIADQLGARSQIPFAPWGDHFDIWLQGIISQFKTHLIIPLAGRPVGHRIGANRLGNFNLPFGDQWPCN